MEERWRGMMATRRSRPRWRRLRFGLGPTDYGDVRKLVVVAPDGLRRPGHDELTLRRGARDGGGDGNGQWAFTLAQCDSEGVQGVRAKHDTSTVASHGEVVGWRRSCAAVMAWP